MKIQPTITEAQRHELRRQAAREITYQFPSRVVVDAAHLLDLLDCADRETEPPDDVRPVQAIRDAVNAQCSCGGLPAHDCNVCGACRVFHALGLGE